MSYRLHVIVGGREVASHILAEGDDVVIGRDAGAAIVVPDRSVSRKHCRARATEDGVEFTDLKSANGLYINKKLFDHATLGDGERVSLGMAQILVEKMGNPSHTGMIPISGLLDGFSDESSAEDASSGRWLTSQSGRMAVTPPPDGKRSVEIPMPGADGTRLSESSADAISSDRPEYATMQKERLALLVETSKSLGQSTDIEQLLTRIVDHLFAMLPVRRAVVALTDDGEEFYARAVRPQAEADDLSSVASLGILRRVVADKEGSIIEDAQLDQKLKGHLSIVASNIKAALCAPIIANNRCLGAIYADYPGRARLYTKSDLDFLTAFASIAAVSLENARLLAHIRATDRLERDLEVAAEIQQGILPNEAFLFEGLEIDWAYWPSLHIGGDFYDVIELPDGRIAVIIGDVSGKSVPAALYMARTLSILRSTVLEGASPGEVMTKTNAMLGSRAERVMFATTLLMYLDPDRRSIEWCNAGHNPPLVRNGSTAEVIELAADGIPLGVDETWSYETSTTSVDPGTIITLYTDGLVEGRDVEGEQFGVDRVNAIVTERAGEPVTAITKAMVDAITAHVKESPHIRDDIAILNIRFSA